MKSSKYGKRMSVVAGKKPSDRSQETCTPAPAPSERCAPGPSLHCLFQASVAFTGEFLFGRLQLLPGDGS